MRNRANKKPATVSGPDAETLDTLSKAALVDLCADLLRAAAGRCDSALSREETAAAVNPTLAARGDRLIPNGGAR
jgi:hypothetical protein